jgi:hypothetical protein
MDPSIDNNLTHRSSKEQNKLTLRFPAKEKETNLTEIKNSAVADHLASVNGTDSRSSR